MENEGICEKRSSNGSRLSLSQKTIIFLSTGLTLLLTLFIHEFIDDFYDRSISSPEPAGIEIRGYAPPLPPEQQLLNAGRERGATAAEATGSSDLHAAGSRFPESLPGAGIFLLLLLTAGVGILVARTGHSRRVSEAVGREIDRLRRERDDARQAVQRLAEQERSARFLIESMPHGIGICDPAGIVTYTNSAYDRLFGLADGEARAMPVWALADSEEERRQLRRDLKNLTHEQPEPIPRSFRTRGRKGKLRHIRLDWICRRDEQQHLTGFFIVLTDVTDRDLGQQVRERTRALEAAGLEAESTARSTALRRPAPLAIPDGTAEHATRGEVRILLVEDNPVNLQVAEAMIEDLGYRVETANNGWAALDRAAAEEFDLIFMDCQLPGLDGYKATELLRQKEAVDETARHTPIIAVTAHAFKEDRERCLAAGMDDYLIKPFTQSQLKALLRLWLPEESGRAAVENAGRNASSQAPIKAASPAVPLDGVLDQQVLDRIRDLTPKGSEPILPKLIGLYLTDAPGLVQTIGTAAGERDSDTVADAAHALKSSSANVGALGLSRLCRDLEAMAHSDQPERIEVRVAEIEAEYGRVRQALEGVGERCT